MSCLVSGVLASLGLNGVCCAASTAGSVCCSLMSCFGCRWNSKLSKLTYLIIFFIAAVLGVVLRYYGEEALASWVPKIAETCTDGRCWGAQAAYRISFALCIFFLTMLALVIVAPITHLGGWLAKVFYFILLLGLSLLAKNDDMQRYAEAARVFAVMFLIAQILVCIDMAYNIHDFLLRKGEEKETEMRNRGWEPGVCSNGWRNLYLLISFGATAAALTGLSLLFKQFGTCDLNLFFISETLVIGIIFVIACMMSIFSKGMLTPSILFAYNSYLAYGAITNNPDTACNPLAKTENQNTTTVIVGLVIATVSVSWMAYSSANSMGSAVSMTPNVSSNAAFASGNQNDDIRTPLPTAGHAIGNEKEDTKSGPGSGNAAAYADHHEDHDVESGTRTVQHADDDTHKGVEQKPYIFHIMMTLGAMYLAMLLTNWGNPSEITATGNIELSTASMWARIASQWGIHLLFLWTLIAPKCCPNRQFA